MINWDVIQIQNSKQLYITCVNICPHSFTQWTSVQSVLNVSTWQFFSYVYLQMHYMADCVLMNLVNQILRRHETNYSHQCTANMNSRREIIWVAETIVYLFPEIHQTNSPKLRCFHVPGIAHASLKNVPRKKLVTHVWTYCIHHIANAHTVPHNSPATI